MQEKALLLVLGCKQMSVITGTSCAQVLADGTAYTVKRVASSNTFLVRRGTTYTEVKYVLDLVENKADLENIYCFVPPSSVWSLRPVDIQAHFHLGSVQAALAEKELKLLKMGSEYARISYADTLGIACYMGSIRESDDLDAKMDIYPQAVKRWALENLTGSPLEVGLYCLLACDEQNNLSGFLQSWRDLVLGDTSIDGLVHHIKSVFLPKEKKTRLLCHLSKLAE